MQKKPENNHTTIVIDRVLIILMHVSRLERDLQRAYNIHMHLASTFQSYFDYQCSYIIVLIIDIPFQTGAFVLKKPYGLVPPTCLAYTNASGQP